MTKQILVVEVDSGTREDYQRYLEAGGYDVYAASSAQAAALAIGTGIRCDLLQTDVDMPDGHAMDGLALVKMMRRRQPDLPILILSAHASLAQQSARIGGPLKVLKKSVGRVELLDAVDAMFMAAAASE